MKITNYNYNEKEISSIISDSDTYLWIAFKQNDSGNCTLQKLSLSNPSQKYFDIDIAITEIKNSYIYSSYIYLAFSDTSLIGRRYSLLNPLTINTDYSIPSGITEIPVDVVADSTYVYFLIPGNVSGQNTKICLFTLDGTFEETIDLATVTNAKSFIIDDNGDLWILTYASPSHYVRVHQLSGGVWTYTVNN